MGNSLAATVSDYNALCRSDLYLFVVEAFRELRPGKIFVEASFLRHVCAELQSAEEGVVTRLLVSLPPRTLKSFTMSVAFPAWVLGRHQDAKFICLSYAQDVSDDFGSDCLRLMESPFYRGVFPNVRLIKRAVNAIETSAGGRRLAVGMTGAYTGRGADYVIVDDPAKPFEVQTDLGRETSNRIFDMQVVSRLDDPTGRILVTHQRLHEEDLIGHLLRSGDQWRQISYPAIAEVDEYVRFKSGAGVEEHRRKAGEVLSSRLPIPYLDERKLLMGSAMFSAQFQQRPVPAEGNIVKTDWIHYLEPRYWPQAFDYLVLSVDTASTTSKNSAYSVILTLGVKDNKVYLLDEDRGRYDYPTLLVRVEASYRKWPITPMAVLIEEMDCGVRLVPDLKQKNIQTIGVKPKLPKDIRLMTVSPMIESGTLLFPKGVSWVADFIVELTSFPGVRFCDRVDAVSQALIWLSDRFRGSTFEVTWCGPVGGGNFGAPDVGMFGRY